MNVLSVAKPIGKPVGIKQSVPTHQINSISFRSFIPFHHFSLMLVKRCHNLNYLRIVMSLKVDPCRTCLITYY